MKITKKTILLFIGYAVLSGVAFFLIGEAINLMTDKPNIPWQRNVIEGLIFGILIAVFQTWVNYRKSKKNP